MSIEMRAPRAWGSIALWLLACGLSSGFVSPASGQPLATPPPPPGAAAALPEAQAQADVTPLRVSYVDGEASFWRPGADDWAPARANTPLAPVDMFYTGPGGNVEIQVGPRAFVRAAGGAQIGLDNHDSDFVQFRVTTGTVALDLRQLSPTSTIEVDTPNAALTIERAGFYRVVVSQDSTAISAHRGGSATVTPAGGAAATVGPNQQAVVMGAGPTVALGEAPALSAWDQWNFQRTHYLLQHADTRYVAPDVYGMESLAQHGTWQPAETYGTVWVPAGVPPGWVPYSTGRWIWDPRFGWTWLDDAPWGWAPYHYGRWVFVRNVWAWAPGPAVVRPVYAPALVVFLDGVRIGVGRPLCWAPLAWGEPLVPWWGRPGFVGVPSWRGWGGPRVVNNVVINRQTTVNVTNITVYRHVNVTNAVVGVPGDRFGRGPVRVSRIDHAEARELRPVHGAIDVKPVAASVVPATGPAVKPPATAGRAVVATRAPRDLGPTLRAQGLPTSASIPTIAPQIVPAPRSEKPRGAEHKPGVTAPGPGSPRAASPSGGPAGIPPVPPGSGPRTRGPDRGAPDAPTAHPAPSTQRPSPAQPSPRHDRDPDQRRGAAIEKPAPPPAIVRPPAVSPVIPGTPTDRGAPEPPTARPAPSAPRPSPAQPPLRHDRDPDQGRGAATQKPAPPPAIVRPPAVSPVIPGTPTDRGAPEPPTARPAPSTPRPSPAQPPPWQGRDQEQRKGAAIEKPAPPSAIVRPPVTPPPPPKATAPAPAAKGRPEPAPPPPQVPRADTSPRGAASDRSGDPGRADR